MDDDINSDLQKCLPDDQMDTDEGPLINENSNGLSHLLTEGEFNSVEAGVDESSTSNQGFLNAVELSASSVGDYLEGNTDGFNADSFDVGDNAVTFPSDSLNNVNSDGDSRLSDSMYKIAPSDNDGDFTEDKSKTGTDYEQESASEMSNDAGFYATKSAKVVQETSPDMSENTEDTKDLESMTKDNSNLEFSEEAETKSKTGMSPSNYDSNKNNKESKEGKEKLLKDAENKEIEIAVQVNEDRQADALNKVDKPIAEEHRAGKPTNEENKEDKSTKEKHIEGVLPKEGEKQSFEEIKKPKTKQTNEGDKNKIKEGQADTSDAVNKVKKEPVDEDVSTENLNTSGLAKKLMEINKSIKKEPFKQEPMEQDEFKQVSTHKVKVKQEVLKMGGAEETEVVSEDELPAVQKPSVKDAENVSDDELPGPKPAELPADTEVVSEDELPSAKKEPKESRKRKPDETRDGYDPGSPTSESESSNKKQAVAKNGECKPVPAEKRSSIDEKPKKKILPELDKYWKVVNDDPTDFTGWTYLLQYVDQESDVEAAREAYDAFLSHYPYCYGYWRKYADYEKRKGSKKKCLEVLERGLKAIPLSVDLWIHYLNHIKATRTDDHAFLRSQYERAIEACGLEFRSDRLWESYIKWEAENGSALNVTNIYDRLLATPTLGYTSHFDNFQEHVMSEPVTGVVARAELVRLRGEVRDAGGSAPALDLPPGEDEPLDHVASEEEAQAIKERVIAARRKVHKTTGEEVAARWTFEEGIKRPYFHVKPLERCQLKNWKAYLDWEKQHGSFKRALVLHERCLIACALYEEFWMRLIKFLEERSNGEPELVALEREVLERACTVHHLDKPELHLYWAHFEEAHGQAARAADILDRIEKTCPTIVQIQYRRVNLERRRGDYEKCCQLYEGYIVSAKSKAIASALSVKYARFLFHVRKDPAAARKVLDEAIAKDPLNPRLHMQRLDLALHTPDTPFEVLEELVQSYEKQEGAELEVCAGLAWRRRELAEELGPAAAARRATHHARALAKHLRKRARKDKHDQPPVPCGSAADAVKKKEPSATPSNNSAAPSSNNAYYQTSAAAQSYDQSYAQPYQPPWGYQQPPGPYQHHPGPWTPYPNYY